MAQDTTRPSSAQLAPAIPPLVRQYIDARLAEDVAPLRDAVHKLAAAIEKAGTGSTLAVEELQKQLEALERRYQESDRTTLTKAKLIAVLKDMGYLHDA